MLRNQLRVTGRSGSRLTKLSKRGQIEQRVLAFPSESAGEESHAGWKVGQRGVPVLPR